MAQNHQAPEKSRKTRFFAPRRGAQNDQDDMISAAIIFGNGYERLGPLPAGLTFPGEAAKILWKTAIFLSYP
jgi:hypothetical protein